MNKTQNKHFVNVTNCFKWHCTLLFIIIVTGRSRLHSLCVMEPHMPFVFLATDSLIIPS